MSTIFKNEKLQTIGLVFIILFMMLGFAGMFIHTAFPTDPVQEEIADKNKERAE